MKIAIDATRAIVERAGIGRYALEITKALIANDRSNEYLIFSTHFNDSAEKTKILESFRADNVKIKRIKIPGSLKEYLWSTKIDLLKYFLEDSEVLFAPSFFEVGLGFSIPQVVTIHDMTMSIFPAQRGEEVSMRLALRTKRACERAKGVICVSNSTKNDLVRLTGLDPKKATRVYPGVTKFEKIAPKLPEGLKKDRYVLFVGTLEPRKNLVGLLRAYDALPLEIKNRFPLAITGGRGWNDSEIYKEFENNDLKKHIVFTGFVSDQTLARLYKDCRLFAYPSLYEGLGFPVMEAQGLGAAVLTSKTSSLPEAGGEGAVCIDPNNVGEMSKELEKIIKDDSLRERLGKSALSNVKRFSWEQSAQQTISILEGLSDRN